MENGKKGIGSTDLLVTALGTLPIYSDFMADFKCEEEAVRDVFEHISIDQFLRALIADSDLIEVVCCLDMIARESDQVITMMNQEGRVYPAEGVPLRHLAFLDRQPSTPIIRGKAHGPIDPLIFNKFMETEAGQDAIKRLLGDYQEKQVTELPQEEEIQTPPSVEDVYRGGFFKNRSNLHWRVNPVVEALKQTFSLTTLSTVIDCGCAIGEYVAGFNERGIPAWGIEGSGAAIEFMETSLYSIQDLRKPLDIVMTRGHTLCYSLEVAEHIEEEYAGIFCDNLTRLSSTILMTAAPPGQKGHGHVNCQPKGYWEAMMANRNYRRNEGLEDSFKRFLKPYSHRKEIACYIQNVMVFESIRLTGFLRS